MSVRLGRLARLVRDDRRGSAAIEFAIVAPLLVLLAAGTLELGSAVVQKMEVQDAAAAGALYATENGWDQAGIAAAVAAAKPGKGVSASPAPALYCGCPTAAGVTTTATCTVACADGSPARKYVRVSAATTRNSFLATRLPLPQTIAASTVASVR